MATTYDRLVEAGAPEIAEPLFYRIREDDDGDLVCEIRQRRDRFGSDVLASRFVITRITPGEELLGEVVKALQGARDDLERNASAVDLIGEYEPRS